MDYEVVANHVNLLQINVIGIITDKYMVIKFIMTMMLKHVLNVNKANY